MGDGRPMGYEVASVDRKRKVYINIHDGNYYILDVGGMIAKGEGYKVFQTDSKDLAYSVWQSTGGEYSDMEIVANG